MCYLFRWTGREVELENALVQIITDEPMKKGTSIERRKFVGFKYELF